MNFPLHSAVLLDFFLHDYQLSENVQFWSGHGWMTVMIVALLAPLAVIPRRIMPWLIGFCLVRQLIVAREYLYSSLEYSPFDLLEPTAWLSRLLGIICAWLLWEVTAALKAGENKRSWQRWLGRGAWLLLLAAGIAGGPDWAGVIETFVMAPVALLLAMALWRHGPKEEAPGLRLMAFGFALFGLATTGAAFAGALESGSLELLLMLVGSSSWFVVGGIGWAVLRHYRTFSRMALAFFLILFTYPIWVGITYGVVMPPTVARTKVQLLGWIESMLPAVPVEAVSRLTQGSAAAGDQVAIEAALRKIMASSAFARRIYVWQPEQERRRVFAGLEAGRPWHVRADRPAYWHAAPDSATLKAGESFFQEPYSAHDGELVDLNVPLRAQPDGPVVAWLTLESNSRPYWRALMGSFVVLVVFFDCFGPYLNAVAILSWRRATERRRLEQLIKVQTSDRAKTEFLAFLGHELRTPLQTILGRAELLQAAPASARHASAIGAQGQLLLRLVNDLLDLGTIEAGRFALRPQPFSLRAALANIDDIVRPLATAKGLNLVIRVADDIPDGFLGDEARLRQVLGNLLGNAVKYTNHGEVRLDIVSDDATQPTLTFRVRDTGPGLPVEKIPELFTLFTRLDSGDTFTREGTGVGLALVRRLTELMGGSVTAGNQTGGGAEFTVQLPFALAAVPATASVAATTRPTLPCRVLIAEDNTAAREVLAEALTQNGHQVTTAVDGPAALAACARQDFDVVVLDVNLPGVDGIEIARRLRAQPKCPRLIGCSAEAFDHVRQAALAAGMDEFLQKPVSLATLGTMLAAPSADNIFDFLREPSAAQRTREILTREWPVLRSQLERAIANRTVAEIRQTAHYLQTSALLLNDNTMLRHCRDLANAAGNMDFSAAQEALTALHRFIAAEPS